MTRADNWRLFGVLLAICLLNLGLVLDTRLQLARLAALQAVPSGHGRDRRLLEVCAERAGLLLALRGTQQGGRRGPACAAAACILAPNSAASCSAARLLCLLADLPHQPLAQLATLMGLVFLSSTVCRHPG